MHEPVIIAVVGVVAIALSALVGERMRVAGPFVLILVGGLAGYIPGAEGVHLDGELVLSVLLPPLLYSASTAVPAMRFRRERGPIAALSILLVVISAVLVGLVFWWIIPGISLAWAIALGAIVSPTDAVATTIVKGVGVSPRLVSILEGEGLLNDATALVMLRAAIAATAATVSVWQVAGEIVYAVLAAVVIGYIVGKLTLALRSRVGVTAVSTALSFTVPFVAALPAEAIGASGLVGAVVAGLVTGHGAPVALSPAQRRTDQENWATIELVLEGTVFLSMGLLLHPLIDGLRESSVAGTHLALAIVCGYLATIIVRAIYVVPLTVRMRRKSDRARVRSTGIDRAREALRTAEGEERRELIAKMQREARPRGGRGRKDPARAVEWVRTRGRRYVADITYFSQNRITKADGTVLVWAGMRGAVTVAAAQTLPESTPDRPVLLLIAFAIAALSLLLQGSTLTLLVRRVHPTPAPSREERAEERERLHRFVRDYADRLEAGIDPHAVERGSGRRTGDANETDGERAAAGDAGGDADLPAARAVGADSSEADRLVRLDRERRALLIARTEGVFDSDLLSAELDLIDSEQLLLDAQILERDT